MAVEVVVVGKRRSGGELIRPRTIIPIKIIRSRVVIFSTELEFFMQSPSSSIALVMSILEMPGQ